MNAVRSLRNALELSQTDFGIKLGKSLPTIQRWETLRPPTGEALVAIATLAEEKGHEQLKKVFLDALVAEMGLERNAGYMSMATQDDGIRRGYMFLRLEGEEQCDAAYAFYQAVMIAARSTKPERQATMTKLLQDFYEAFEKAAKQ